MAVIVFSCRKDDPIPADPPNDPGDTIEKPVDEPISIIDNSIEDTGCYEISGQLFQTWYAEDRFQYKMPYYNPNNSDEFIYNFIDHQNNISQLIKYNIQTDQKTVLVNNFSSISAPKWGYNGKIVYDKNYQVWVVNDDGNNQVQLTSAYNNIFPALDIDGNDIYFLHSQTLGHPYYYFKLNINNGVIDTLMFSENENYGYARSSDVSVNNKIIAKTYFNEESYIGLSTQNKSSFTPIVNLNDFESTTPRGLCWDPDGETIYFSIVGGMYSGLYRMNINENTAYKLVKFCENKKYINISCSPDGDYLIGERVDSRLIEDTSGSPTGEIRQKSNVYKVDLNTLVETKIDLE